METLGLLSGIGHLPVDVALSAKAMGYRVVAVGVVPDIDPELSEAVDAYYDIHIGKIGKIISTLKKNDVKAVTMIGKVTKELLSLSLSPLQRLSIPEFSYQRWAYRICYPAPAWQFWQQ